MDNRETIQKLEELQSLLDEAIYLGDYIEDGAFRETREKINALRAETGLPGGTPAVFDNFPVFPIDGSDLAEKKANADKSKLLFYGALGAMALFLILYFAAGILMMLAVLGVGASVLTYKIHKGAEKVYTDRKKAYDASVEKYEATMGAFRRTLANYDAERQAGLDKMAAYAVTYGEAFAQQNAYCVEWSENKKVAQARRDEVLLKLDDYDFMPSDYWPLIPSVISLLKSGRADDYKEALNLAIREQREEEEAAARRADEERRAAILERQAEEERRHNAQMERQQAEHNRQMERVEQQRADEERRANQQAERDRRDATRRENEAKMRSDRRCQTCINFGHGCPGYIQNCGGYRSKMAK